MPLNDARIDDRTELIGLDDIPAPVLVGAVGGSGTRVVVRILAHAGFFIGAHRNFAEDSEPVMTFYDAWMRPYLECGGKWSAPQSQSAAVAFRQAIRDHRRGIADAASPWVMKVP